MSTAPIGPAELADMTGQEIGVSSWIEVGQRRIDEFAHCTEDRQWIHVDVERAARESPAGGTIAHGYLTLALLAPTGMEILVPRVRAKQILNYGLDKVRFLAPVLAGKRVRNRIKLAAAEDKGGGRWLLQAVGWDMVAAMLATDLARLDDLETAIAVVLDRLPAPRYRATATCSASSLASLATFDFTVAVPGAEVGDAVLVIPPGLLNARIVYSALVSASGIVTIRLSNPSASSATSNVGSGSWGVLVMK